jgi:hypothetical protein
VVALGEAGINSMVFAGRYIYGHMAGGSCVRGIWKWNLRIEGIWDFDYTRIYDFLKQRVGFGKG